MVTGISVCASLLMAPPASRGYCNWSDLQKEERGMPPLHIHPSSLLSTSSLLRKKKGCLLYTYLILTQWNLLLTKARMTASQLRTESSCPILLGLKGRDGRMGKSLGEKAVCLHCASCCCNSKPRSSSSKSYRSSSCNWFHRQCTQEHGTDL